MLLHVVRLTFVSVLLSVLLWGTVDNSPLFAEGKYIPPIQQGEQQDEGEDGVPDSRDAVIEILPAKGGPLGVYAKRDGQDLTEPFFYELYPVIVPSSEAFYDPESRQLNFKIHLAKIPEDLMNQTAKRVAFSVTKDVGQAENVNFIPLGLRAYEVYLQLGNAYLPLLDLQKNNEYSGEISVNETIEDQSFHEALLHNPSSLTVVFRAFYRFKVINVQVAKVELSINVASEIIETVLGSTASEANSALVTRNVLNEIKRKSENKLLVQLEAGTSDDILDTVQAMSKQFLEIPELTVAEIEEMEDTLYYQAKNVQVEIQPATFRELTTSWSNEESFRNSFQETWDNFRQLDQEASSTEEFFEKLHTVVKSNSSTKAKANLFKIFDAGGGFSFNFDLTWDKQSSQQRTDFEKFHEQVKNNGSVSEETLKNIVEHWTGERDISRISPKNLKIYRISKIDLGKIVSVSMNTITELPSTLRAKSRGIALTESRDAVNSSEIKVHTQSIVFGSGKAGVDLGNNLLNQDYRDITISTPEGTTAVAAWFVVTDNLDDLSKFSWGNDASLSGNQAVFKMKSNNENGLIRVLFIVLYR